MQTHNIYLQKSSRSGKKWMVTIIPSNGTGKKTVHFGADGYQDYTMHKDPSRMKKYISRHKARENWTKSGLKTAGFWSRWILWNKPSLSGSIKSTESKFKIKIFKKPPPLKNSLSMSPAVNKGKILNPNTGRYVLKTGKIGMSIISKR